jgi:adenine-specific DNA glycosylase
LQKSIPVPKAKKTFTPLHHVALLIPRGSGWLVRLNPPGSWWAGLWDFPRVDITELDLLGEGAHRGRAAVAKLDALARSRIAQAARATLGLESEVGPVRFALRHTVTRYRIQLDCVDAVAPSTPSGWRSCTLAELTQLPLSAPARKIAGLLQKSKE